MTTAQERKKQERQARRRLIQEAAREIFAAKGYAKTSIEQVAQRASLSVGAIYLYFRSKEDLYMSLIEAPLTGLAAELAEFNARTEPHHGSPLRTSWSRLVDWATSDPENIVILRALAQPEVRSRLSTEVTEAVSDGLRRVSQALEASVVAGIETGLYRPVAPTETADVLWSLFLGAFHAADARKSVSLQGASFEQSAQWAFEAIETGLRLAPARVAEAA
ncbi:MAG: TetR/AcrR family transcriptional regulator [Proteobacteria bacterium]|nr:TetR/AcrR family transcriptional regulator [Pseudomonadota bacterium]